MSRIKPLSLPVLCFAHEYGAEQYDATLPRKEGIMEITCVTEGTCTFIRNGMEYHACAGDILCNTYRHEIRVVSDGIHRHRTVCFAMDFDLTEEGGVFPEIPFLIRPRKGNESCIFLINEIIRSYGRQGESTLRDAGLFLQLLDELGREARRVREGESPGDGRRVRSAKRYILDNITRPLRQRDVAAHVGITPEYLCAIFKKTEGCTVMRYVNRVKLERIRVLMEREHIPLARAAGLYGYADPNYVSRLYRAYFGVTLTEAVELESTVRGR